MTVVSSLRSNIKTDMQLICDSLDRTNVVQSQLSKWVLNNQLREVGVLSTKESIDEHPTFLHLFRNGECVALFVGDLR